MTRSPAARLIATVLVSMAILDASTAAAPAEQIADGAIIARERYAFPFKNRGEWLAFVGTLLPVKNDTE